MHKSPQVISSACLATSRKAEAAAQTEGDLGVRAAAASVVLAVTAVHASAILDVSDSCDCA